MVYEFKDIVSGYNKMTDMRSKVMMETGIYRVEPGQFIEVGYASLESAFLLLDGSIVIGWENDEVRIARHSVFDELPYCLHVPQSVKVRIRAEIASEILIQKTENQKGFPARLYSPEDISQQVLGNSGMQGTARRILRDIFNYSNAPCSNMVMGEVITLPGKWSSYPPHHHPQPEVYYYRFDKPQGFGISVIGDEAHIVRSHSVSSIPGGLCHPQVSAPGYAMYYCWMIRHLENNPWTARIDDPVHSWLHDPDALIWLPD